MTIAQEISTIISPIAAVVILTVCVLKILEIRKVQEALNSAIVLVPLYKKHYLLIVGLGVLFAIVAGAVFVIITQGYLIAMLGLSLTAISLIALLITMLGSNFAVLDSGVLLPYKFVEWSELYDYIIDNKKNSVMFTGDSHGRYTLSSTSIMMSFNKVDLKKLEEILSKNKIKHKVNNG